MQFEMTKRNYIVCPKCNNDRKFECFGDRLDDGIFEIKIKCSECGWVSDELYEESGYFPEISSTTVQHHVKTLHDMQQEEKQDG